MHTIATSFVISSRSGVEAMVTTLPQGTVSLCERQTMLAVEHCTWKLIFAVTSVSVQVRFSAWK